MANFGRRKVTQHDASRLSAVDHPQIALPLPGSGLRPQVASFTLDQIRRVGSVEGAIEMSMRCSGLRAKEFYLALDLDKGHWSRIESGDSPFPFPKLNQFMDVAGNEIPLIWSAERRGWDWLTIRQHHSDTERRIAELEQENADLRRSLTLVVAVKGKSE